MFINTKMKEIVINAMKTTIKCLKVESLKNDIEFSELQMLDCIMCTQHNMITTNEILIIKSCLYFCLDIGGLDLHGLRFSAEELKEVYNEIEVLS